VFPSLKNEFGPFSSKRVGYDNKFWRDSRDARAVLGNTLSGSMVGAIVSKSSWPLDAPQNFLTRTGISGTTGSAAIKFDSTAYLTQQPFVPFSSNVTSGTITGISSLGFNFFVPAGGELQNTYFSYFTINMLENMFLVHQNQLFLQAELEYQKQGRLQIFLPGHHINYNHLLVKHCGKLRIKLE
jgi:hypothetical protein